MDPTSANDRARRAYAQSNTALDTIRMDAVHSFDAKP